MSKNVNRKTAPKGKIVRRLGFNIFGNQKYDKLLGKKPTPPGGAPRRRGKQSIYGLQLQEKQKIRFAYGVSEKQLRAVFNAAKKMEGVTGSNMLILLESRLDNVVYRMGFCSSRPQARQLVRHGHFLVNGRKVDMPGVIMSVGDVVTVRERSAEMKVIKDNLTVAAAVSQPAWLTLEGSKGTIVRMPERADIPTVADEQIVVEFYSK
ncbi:MAG: 30S ribosomal protein S4 [Pyramidobacter sp.]|nr:30S ribosomal protein S4 [Pyramidobacter sp.]